MHNLLPALLPRLEDHRLRGWDAGPQFIYPHYADLSLVNLPSSVCYWLGVPAFGAPPLAQDILAALPQNFRSVILLLVDGMGLDVMQTAQIWAEQDPDFAVWGYLAERGVLAPLTSIAPSTTASALTTLWTGCPPAAHGVLGYEMWLKEYGVIANMILHSPSSFPGDIGSLRKAGFDPETFLPVPKLGPHLARSGVRAHAFQHTHIARSGLSMMLMPEVNIHPYRSLGDLWVTLDNLLDAQDEQSYYYIYWGDLDEHSHRFGPQDSRVALELANFSRQLGYFIRQRDQASARRGAQDTLLIITADHGHISTPRHPRYELRNHPGLLDTLVMAPSGESRLALAYLRPGQQERFLSYVQETWPDEFIPIPSEQAVQAGLFGYGPLHSRLSERAGDYVITARDSAYWWFASRDNHLLGRHGGLSRTEMLVPFLAVPL